MKRPQGTIIQNLFFMSWAAFCTALFIIFSGRVSALHSTMLVDLDSLLPKLGRIELIKYFLDLAVAILGVSIFTLACLSLGSVLLDWLLVRRNRQTPDVLARPVRLATAFLLGSGVFSIFFLTLGAAFKLTTVSVLIILAFGTLTGIRSLVTSLKATAEDSAFNILEGNADRKIYILSISILLLSLMYTSARLSYDSVAFYFSDAKITALTGISQSYAHDSFVVSSFHAGVSYSALILTFGDQAARMFSWVNGLVIIIFALALSEQFGLSKSSKRILLALLMTTTAFIDLFGDGKIDLATSAPALAAVYWMVRSESKSHIGYYITIGLFAGLAIISRPFNALLLGILFALYYLGQIYQLTKTEKDYLRTYFARLAAIITTILILILFHLSVNWMILGDPLAPFTNAAKINTGVWQWSFDPKNLWIMRLLYPLTVTFINSPQSLGTISPLFIAFLPAIFIKEIRRHLFSNKALIGLTTMAIITIAIWITTFFTVVEIRYVFFLWVILFLPLSVIAEKVIGLQDHTGRIMELMLVLVLIFVNFRVIYISLDTYSPMDENGNAHCYDHPFCDFLQPINVSAGSGERVLTMNAFRYYLRTDLFACSTKADEYSKLRESSLVSADKFWQEVARQGYTFIAYEKNYGVRHLFMEFAPSPENAPPWIKLDPVYGTFPEDNEVAYRVTVLQPQAFNTLKCVQDQNGVWVIK